MKFGILILIVVFSFTNFISAQRPPNGDPPRDGGGGGRKPEWEKIVDVNKNGKIEQEEYRAAADAFFRKHDRNGNGILEENELPPPPQDRNRPPMPPPSLFLENGEFNLTREEFNEKANLRFITIDMNGDRGIDREEMNGVHPHDKPRFENTAMAQFVGAEIRFGDKIVKNMPFSAETVREESKRLYDGSIVKNQSSGLIYRDGEGRIRQEQPFERIGGFAVVGINNQPIKLVQIIDFVSGDSFSLNTQSKTYSKIPYLQNSPLTPKNESQDGKRESLGTLTLEGVKAEGERTTVEIRAGEIGNDKPIYVVTERWFSNELQMVVLSKHTDPFIGEVTFRLVNIKLGEPAPELFKVPDDYDFFDARKNRDDVNKSIRRGKKND